MVYQEAGNQCAFCDINDVHVLEVHHIKSKEEGGGNEPQNLILVCSNCHSKITSGIITKEEVVSIKGELIYTRPRKSTQLSTSNVVSIRGEVKESIFANVVNFRGSKKSKTLKMNYSAGTIGADVIKKNYLDHLIHRYYEYRKADKSFGAYAHANKFNYAEIHKSIESKFKAKTFFIPINRFQEVCQYVQNRIDKTILAKTNKSEGNRNYSTFEEYEKEQSIKQK